MDLCVTEESTSVLADPTPVEDDTNSEEEEEELTGVDVSDLDAQLKHNLASLFFENADNTEHNTQHTIAGGSLSTFKRPSYIVKKFPVVEPVEFVTDKQGQNIVYSPLIKLLQALLSKDDVSDKALMTSSSKENEYGNYRDGSHFNENTILAEEEFRIALVLYNDDFEVANPIGTYKEKHKLCAVYWATLHPK